MLSKVLLNSVLATPALVGAALIVSSSAMAAEVQTSSKAAALMPEAQTSPNSNKTESTVAPKAAEIPSRISTAPAAALLASTPANASTIAVTPAPATITQPPAQAAPTSSFQFSAVAQPAPVQQAQAQSVPVQVAQTAPVVQAAPDATRVSSLDQIQQYSSEGGSQSQAQVTSITQLSDVKPTDWAYQALQSLVERYGCIAGYPDGTYKGQRAMTRFEFAAGMNACLDRISELIASSTADLATKEDLATLQRLQEEFAAELAALRGRVNGLEARTSELEANQFSTTTKLNGETIFSVGVPIIRSRQINQDNSRFRDQTIAGYRLRLNFDTSFTGEDLLRARLQAQSFGNFSSFRNNTGWQWAGSPGSGQVTLDKLFYTFPIGPVRINIGGQNFGNSDFVTSTVSPFDDSGQGSLTYGLGTPPQYNFIPAGSGAGAIIGIGKTGLSIDFGYAANNSTGANAGNPSPGNGLFNGNYGAIAQLTYLSKFFDAALMYSNSFSRTGFGSTGGFLLGTYEGYRTSATTNGSPEVANIYGGQVNFKLGFVQIGGGIMYAPIRVLGYGDYDVWSYQGTLAFPDLLGKGNLLGFVVGVPPRIAGTTGGLRGNLSGVPGLTRQDTAILAEAFYRFRLNDNISITPGVVYIAKPGNDNGASDTLVGAIRTTFTF
jgi:hypothetical protein